MISQPIDGRSEANGLCSPLQILVCGAAGAGKSMLISQLMPVSGTSGEKQAPFPNVDPFGAIVIDHQVFTSDNRKISITETSGDKQHSRQIVAGAPTTDLALILIDASKGVVTQTKQHSYLLGKLGIDKVVLAISKMDLVGYEQDVFERIEADFRSYAAEIDFDKISAIPVSGLHGDNVTQPSVETAWYDGPALLTHLNSVETSAIAAGEADQPLRMSIQQVSGPDRANQEYSGVISNGSVQPGDTVRVVPSGISSKVTRLITAKGDLPLAVAGQSVTLTLADKIENGIGQVITASAMPCQSADQFESTIIWMDEEELLPGRAYLLKLGAQTVSAHVQRPKYEIDTDTLVHTATLSLGRNSIGVANITTDKPIAFESYESNRKLGGFLLIDMTSDKIVAAGMLHFFPAPVPKRSLGIDGYHP